MLEELRARFRTRFIDTARDRIRRCLAMLSESSSAGNVASELHSLAGEAAMLGFDEVSVLAHDGEAAARRWLAGSTAAHVECARVVRSLGRAVDAMAGNSGPMAGNSGPMAGNSGPMAGNSGPMAGNSGPMAGNSGPMTGATAGAGALAALTNGPAGARPDATAGHSSDGARRILVVDDSRLAGEELAESLGDAGFEVRIAADRDAAVRELGGFAPALVLTDVQMPGVAPAAMCRALRAAASGPVMIMLMSGRTEKELATLARAAEADGFITKQHGTEHIVAHVRRALKEAVS
jgi:CheY-like chemotaxis protein/HPt (histidine-containing phosphotransfer) domain-containing protein